MISHVAAPELDKYQLIHEHKPVRIQALDTGLGYLRANNLVVIQLTQRSRRTEQQKLCTKP